MVCYIIFSFILPDVQYHFHGMNPDDVVIHAYNMLYFILENDILLVMVILLAA